MIETHTDALVEAARLARAFREHAAERDANGQTPKVERDLMRASGLLTTFVRTDAGVDWPTLLRVIREIATADGSLAHLFGYHYLDVFTPHLIGTPEQRDRWYAETV